MRRRLILSLFSCACYDQDYDRNYIRYHLEKFIVTLRKFNVKTERRNEIVQIKKKSEQYRSDYGHVRFPDCEDNQSNGDPAERFNSIVGPAVFIDTVEESAETGDHASDTGCKVFIFVYVDTRSVSGCRILSHSSEMKSETGPEENKRCDERNNETKVNKESVRQEDLTEPSEF